MTNLGIALFVQDFSCSKKYSCHPMIAFFMTHPVKLYRDIIYCVIKLHMDVYIAFLRRFNLHSSNWVYTALKALKGNTS